MAIFDYNNTINIMINEYCLDFDDNDYINEAGLGIEHTSGFYALSTKLIALAKKVGGKLTKKKNYTSKSIKYQIQRNEELRKKYVEELEQLKNNDYKIKTSMIAKWFFGLYILTTVVSSISSFMSIFVSSPMTYSHYKKQGITHVVAKVTGNSINNVASDFTRATNREAIISATKILAVINAITSAGMTVTILADYKKSLNNGIKQIDENIKQLNSYYDKMVKIENSKNK